MRRVVVVVELVFQFKKGKSLIKKISALVLFVFLFSSCGFHTQIQDARNIYHQLKENTSDTPPEYYAKAKPASFSPDSTSDSDNIMKGASKATETDTRDSHDHKTQYILLGTLAGVALIAGIVIPIVVLKK